MNNDDFYRGLLSELHKLASTDSQAQIQPKPIAPIPQVQQPLDLGVQPKYSPNLNAAKSSWAGIPQARQSEIINRGAYAVSHGNTEGMQSRLSAIPNQMKNDIKGTAWAHPFNALNEWATGGQGAQQFGKDFSDLNPEERLQFIQSTSEKNPELSGAVRGSAGAVARQTVDKSSMGDLISNAVGGSKDPNTKAVLNDPQISSYANKMGWNRATNIAGGWMGQHPWITGIVGTLGVAGIASLLFKLFNSGDSQPNQTVNNYYGGNSQPFNQRSNSPSFL